MATYVLADSNGHRYDFESYGSTFTASDAFDLADFLTTKGYLESGVEVNARPYWSNNIPDPRTP